MKPFSYEQTREHIWKKRCDEGWMQYGRDADFHTFGTYSFSEKRISGADAYKKFKRFHTILSRKHHTHTLTIFGTEKKRKRCWIREFDRNPRHHIHDTSLFEDTSLSKEMIADEMEEYWNREYGDALVLPFDPGKGGITYTANHRNGRIFLLSCPNKARVCRRGKCYWKERHTLKKV